LSKRLNIETTIHLNATTEITSLSDLKMNISHAVHCTKITFL